MTLQSLLRANIRQLTPYASARDEYKGTDAIFLDANENPFDTGYNRYPDPYQRKLKERIVALKGHGLAPEQLFLGNGSDEGIDLLLRAFCEPGQDNVVAIDPSYGMYQVCADTHGIAVRKVLLRPDFSLDPEALLAAVDAHTKVIFLCSPNNPTANALDPKAMQWLLDRFQGLLVIDEAYIDFAPEATALPWLQAYERLIVLQTFSKAWGLAGIRLGMAFAHREVIAVMNKIKMPYNINALTQQYALEVLSDTTKKDAYVAQILSERARLAQALPSLPCILEVYPSDANFLLAKTTDAQGLYDALVARGIVVRNRSKVALCAGCLRLTVGTPAENDALLAALEAICKAQ
jgi:histidinol-phosphate aminotransferase